MANDSDPDGQALVVAAVDAVSACWGVVSNSGVGSFTYTPPPDWSGTDWFDYTVSDGTATDEATVIVIVVPVNDAPVAGDDPDLNDNPAAFQVAVMGTLHIAPAVLLDDDTDQEGDPLTLSPSGPVATARGSVQCDASGCTYTRTAAGTASTPSPTPSPTAPCPTRRRSRLPLPSTWPHRWTSSSTRSTTTRPPPVRRPWRSTTRRGRRST